MEREFYRGMERDNIEKQLEKEIGAPEKTWLDKDFWEEEKQPKN